MTEIVRVFVGIPEFHRNAFNVAKEAIEEVNKIYARDGIIELIIVNERSLNLVNKSTRLQETISTCHVAVFIIDLVGYLMPVGSASRSVMLLDDVESAWNIAYRLNREGNLKHLAVFASRQSIGSFTVSQNDDRGRLLARAGKFVRDIEKSYLVQRYSSSSELASAIVGTFVRWQLSVPESQLDLTVIPDQSRLGLTFGGDDRAPLDIVDLFDDNLLSTSDQQQLFIEIRERAELLLAECDNSSNRLAALRMYATKLIGAMGGTISDLKILKFWPAMNSLRRRAETDERIRQSEDPEDSPLPEGVAGLLLDLVDHLNLFRAYQPRLTELDELAQDPITRTTANESFAAARELAARALQHQETVTREAAAALQNTISEASGSDPSAERAKQFSIRSARNLSLEVIRRVYNAIKAEPGFAIKEMRAGIYRQVGQSFATYLGPFILQCDAQVHVLLNTLGSNVTLQHVFKVVVDVIRSK